MKTHESHVFDESNWRCNRCGVSPLAVDAALRCIPIVEGEAAVIDYRAPDDAQLEMLTALEAVRFGLI